MFLVVDNYLEFHLGPCRGFVAERMVGINPECVSPQKEFQQGLKSLQLCRLLEGSNIHALLSLGHLVPVHFLLF